MGIEEFLKKFGEDKEFAATFKQYTNFADLLKAVNDMGYSITKEEVMAFLEKQSEGPVSDEDLEKLVMDGDQPLGFSTACSDACSYGGCHK